MQNQLGEYLQQLRVHSDLSLSSISKKTKVRLQFLKQIENNEVIKMPKIIVRSYVLNFGKTVAADRDLLINKFDELYVEVEPPLKTKLPPKKTISTLLIWSIVFVLLALSVGLTLSNKKQSRIQTAEFKAPSKQALEKVNYSSPANLEELLLNSPNPSFDNNNKK